MVWAGSARRDLAAPSCAAVIDGQGWYLMPGLVDAHIHSMHPEIFGRVLIAKDAVLGPKTCVTGSIPDRSPPLIPSSSIGL